MDVPDVHYARAGGVAIAYQVVGEGQQTLVFSPQVSGLMSIWISPHTRSFLEHLARHARVVVLNPRGTGLSDRPRNVTLEARMDDFTSVLDAVGVSRASLVGISTSANVCALFAASYPERVERLVLIHPFPRAIRSEDYPWGLDEEGWLTWLRDTRDRWGERDFMEAFRAGRRSAHWRRSGRARHLRLAGSARAQPHGRGRLGSAGDGDRHRRDPGFDPRADPRPSPSGRNGHPTQARDPARFVADRIRGSRLFGLHAEGASPFSGESADAILEFLRGQAPVVVPDSVLATVLFTDLVGSTTRAAELGDQAWRDLLLKHHEAVRRELARFRGDEVDTAGDGFFCRFDGPARAMACARAIVEGAKDLDLDVRAGIHTGECELAGEKIAGIAVVTGSRISALAKPGEVLVSSTVKDLVAGSGFGFDERGEHELKGVPGRWRLYAVVDG
jgi:class 3 adenylate cyclase